MRDEHHVQNGGNSRYCKRHEWLPISLALGYVEIVETIEVIVLELDGTSNTITLAAKPPITMATVSDAKTEFERTKGTPFEEQQMYEVLDDAAGPVREDDVPGRGAPLADVDELVHGAVLQLVVDQLMDQLVHPDDQGDYAPPGTPPLEDDDVLTDGRGERLLLVDPELQKLHGHRFCEFHEWIALSEENGLLREVTAVDIIVHHRPDVRWIDAELPWDVISVSTDRPLAEGVPTAWLKAEISLTEGYEGLGVEDQDIYEVSGLRKGDADRLFHGNEVQLVAPEEMSEEYEEEDEA
jgi:hypothetical protein